MFSTHFPTDPCTNFLGDDVAGPPTPFLPLTHQQAQQQTPRQTEVASRITPSSTPASTSSLKTLTTGKTSSGKGVGKIAKSKGATTALGKDVSLGNVLWRWIALEPSLFQRPRLLVRQQQSCFEEEVVKEEEIEKRGSMEGFEPLETHRRSCSHHRRSAGERRQ